MKRMMLLGLLVLANIATAQSRWAFGTEQDVLPWVLKGYFANAWIGKEHVRVRVLTAYVQKPDFLLPSDFKNNHVRAYAIVADYFLRTEWKGPWLGVGVVRWENSIQNQDETVTRHFNNWLLNGSAGYHWKLSDRFYFGPWAGLHLRVSGPSDIMVAGKKYDIPMLNPEASLKVGFIVR
jgi:hypothetical protein